MKVLIDTHALLWFHTQDARLSEKTRTAIESGEHECWYSIISLWEIAIKHGLGKLELFDGLDASFKAMERSNLRLLDLTREHVLTLATLPAHHRDPFDRILIAQAKHEGMSVLTGDKEFGAYGVPLMGV